MSITDARITEMYAGAFPYRDPSVEARLAREVLTGMTGLPEVSLAGELARPVGRAVLEPPIER